MKIFCERLKALRKSKGITQKAVAKALEIAERHYQKIEYGEVVPGLDLAITLADYFGVSIDFLVGKTDDPTPQSTTKSESSIMDKDAPRREALLALWDSATPEQKDHIFRRLSGEKRLD